MRDEEKILLRVAARGARRGVDVWATHDVDDELTREQMKEAAPRTAALAALVRSYLLVHASLAASQVGVRYNARMPRTETFRYFHGPCMMRTE
jgi:hypothetical protein